MSGSYEAILRRSPLFVSYQFPFLVRKLLVTAPMTSAAATILVVCIVLAAAMVAAVSRHKKSGTGDVKLLGSTGLVDTKLDPHGTVLIHGELWCACSNDGSAITTRSKVSVVGMRDHSLLVRLQDQ